MSDVQKTESEPRALDLNDAADAILNRWEDAEKPSEDEEVEATTEDVDETDVEEVETEEAEDLEEVEDQEADPDEDDPGLDPTPGKKMEYKSIKETWEFIHRDKNPERANALWRKVVKKNHSLQHKYFSKTECDMAKSYILKWLHRPRSQRGIP